MYVILSGTDNKPQLHETDNDSGKGTMTSYGSVNSLNSNSSSFTTALPNDNPEQFEAFKQQKEIMENGIEMWVALSTFSSSLSYSLYFGGQ